MVKVTFWGSVVALAYAYFGYHLVRSILVRVSKKREITPVDAFAPTVTIVVPAYNEERVIERGIRNLLDQQRNWRKSSPPMILQRDREQGQAICCAGVQVLEFEKNRGRADVHK